MKTKTHKLLSLRRVLAGLSLLLLVLVRNASLVSGQEFVRGYETAAPIERGMVVRLNESNPQVVQLLTAAQAEKMLGVVIDPTDAPAALSSETQQTFVATSGTYPMLVSDEKGSIQPGDFLTVSSIDGVAAKATSNEKVIVGTALGGFDGRSGVLSTSTVGDKPVAMSRISSEVGVAANPLYQAEARYSQDLLRNLARSVSDKPISNAKLYLSIAILLVSTILTVVMVYSGVRGGLVAIGRNPLSRGSIGHNIILVVAVATLIFSIGLSAVYLLLKL